MTAPAKFILLAEDDPYVAELILHVLQSQPSPPLIVHVHDGVETLDFLHSQGQFEHRPPGSPAVVLLDVKMPRVDGLEVLRQIKSDETLKSTPVVMLTSSRDERDVQQSYQLGANAYVVKPVEFQRFATMLKHIETFWLQVNQPPSLTFAEVPVHG
jgi:CheY-like chemotaxis protein